MNTLKKTFVRKNFSEGEKGITLFLAILITGVLLLVSTAIITLAVREAFLSSSSRESQYAFYAADTGTECAIYWDVKNSTGNTAFGTSTPLQNISCMSSSITPIRVTNGNDATTTFSIQFPSEPYCAIVSVSKTADGKTKIESLGYNTCSSSNPRRVERAVRITY